MPEPVIAAYEPVKVELERGKEYYWCACGRSANQPFCDGSHRGTSFTPMAFVAEEEGESYLCQCKHTNTAPFCDGSHAKLDAPARSSTPAKHGGGMPEPVPTPEEPAVVEIHNLAKYGLSKTGHHGPLDAMGVPRDQLPHWDDIQILAAQFATRPQADNADVGTELVIGPKAKKPLALKIPLIVSDMSFGALSEEAKTAMARGAELAGTGICSGEGGMLPEEQQENSRYFYELATAKFGFDESLLTQVQAFHFKGGQGAKTGTGGHLPGNKVVGRIAKVRGLPEGTPAVSPSRFEDLVTVDDFRAFADKVRAISGGIPIGMKLSANHIEKDIAFALEVGVDYIILDGRGGGTGAAPLIFRNHISVPTLPALARARHFLDCQAADHVTLIITGGLRVAPDFVKALCLGADGIALANSAMQSIGCVGARICHTNNCPTGVATQNPELRARLKVQEGAERLHRFFDSSVELMKVLARACGYNHLNQFNKDDITSWKKGVAELTGIQYAGFDSNRCVR